MADLRHATLSELIRELQNRDGIRSMEIKKNEVHKVQAAGCDDSRSRYIKGEGPAIILEIKSN
ncbi:BC1881 family protein [Clostridium tertium]